MAEGPGPSDATQPKNFRARRKFGPLGGDRICRPEGGGRVGRGRGRPVANPAPEWPLSVPRTTREMCVGA